MSNIDVKQDDSSGWDHYWSKNSERKIYDFIAEFYRKFIIRPALNFFIKKYFKKNDVLIHAGCGSGQVDRDIRSYANITGLDYSPEAIKVFQKENGSHCKGIVGSVFAMPFEANSIDGIYNLGVMEHFTEEDIKKILIEFSRVLKVNGKIVLFWPPEFGMSVIFFKVLGKIFSFFGKTLSISPDEITRIQSTKHALKILEGSGFKSVQNYFGPRDVFTYFVLVAQKT